MLEIVNPIPNTKDVASIGNANAQSINSPTIKNTSSTTSINAALPIEGR